MKKVTEGLKAIAETVALCRPEVVAAYPITPQTHIVEELSVIIANGRLKCEFINVESEFAAASVVLGASVAGVRAYSTTSSQGLLLMAEVLFNMAGMRLPVVITDANRAVSAPINIWNDWQDTLTVRDAGMIHLFAEDNQEACDMHLQAFKIAEDHEVMLPVMVNVDGFILTHAFDPIDYPDQAAVDKYLPKYVPMEKLDVKNPLSFGLMGGPDRYLETRYAMAETMKSCGAVIRKAAQDFNKMFGRNYGELVEEYKMDDAEIVLVSMGSIISSMKDVADDLRAAGKKVGVLKIRCYRPFPVEDLIKSLCGKKKVIILEKAISLGGVGILTADIKAALYGQKNVPEISDFILGLGGRDIRISDIKAIVAKAEKANVKGEFYGLDPKLVEEMDK